MLGQRMSGLGMGSGPAPQGAPPGGPSIPPGFGNRPLAGMQTAPPPLDLGMGPRPGEAAAVGAAARQQHQHQHQQRVSQPRQSQAAPSAPLPGAGGGADAIVDDKQDRNRRLMARIRDSVGDEGLAAFRQLSGRFRSADVSADDYVALMAAQFGESVTVGILPDLLALLPDEARRRDLSGAAMRFRRGLPREAPGPNAVARGHAGVHAPPGFRHAAQGRSQAPPPPLGPGVDLQHGPRPSSAGPALRGTWARGAGRGGSGSAAAALARMDTSARPRGWGR